MSRLTDLIAQAKRENPKLGSELEREIRSTQQRTFGLVFERHLPAAVELPGRPVRRGDTVKILPPRGSKEKPSDQLWYVEKIDRNTKPHSALLTEASPEADTEPEIRSGVNVDDLLVTVDQDETIYPGLVQTGEVIGSDDPNAAFHTVINAENYHALKMLTYTHRHAVDCIYIDPPYNTGAKDWKYNNDYVDGEDDYRHSKWLSFMERRLLIAKELLRPEDSVLIVTIDEKEYLRLGLLLEQTFPEAKIQMISSVINPKGTARSNEFSRVDEFIYFVMIGDYKIIRSGNDMSGSKDVSRETKVRWRGFSRTGRKGLRPVNPGSWYPLYFWESDDSFHSVGDTVWEGEEPKKRPVGTYEVWPPVRDGEEYSWAMVPDTFRRLHSIGAIRFGEAKKGAGRSISYLTNNQLQMIEDGIIEVTGRDPNGSLEVMFATGSKTTAPKTQWNLTAHEAGAHGTNLITSLLPGRRFPFPKSLYAVEDALRFFIKDKPDATVLDFFSGSGTTAHAVMRLNKQDGGNRRSISVTNNEVSVEEQVKLRKEGIRPGDPEWEQWGICDYVTKPRIKAAITGETPDGEPIKGDYKFTDEFPMADGFKANARFFTLTYEPKTKVRYGLAFDRIAPLLWIRAGQTGRIIESIPETGWDVAESYGVIENVADIDSFVEAIKRSGTVTTAYIVTNDDLVFSSSARKLAGLDHNIVRLYSTYLNNFAFQNSEELA